MGLADTARDLQKEAASPELLWLRDMRRFVNTCTEEKINAMWQEIGAFDKKPESLTEDGRKKMCVMIAQVHECAEKRKVYLVILKCAEAAERKEKGGGEVWVRERREKIETIEKKIREKYAEERKWQLELEGV